MLDIEKHKEFLWKYTLSYGEMRQKKGEKDVWVFPFEHRILEDKDAWESYRTPELEKTLFACQSLEEIFDLVSDEYLDFYFMEISAHLHEPEDKPLYSRLLKKTYDRVGITEYITQNNYEHLLRFADDETQVELNKKLSAA